MEIMNGFDTQEKSEVENAPIQIEDAKAEVTKKRQPFALWKVGDDEYRLKLTTENICKLENQFKGNIISIVTAGDIPALAVMLTVVQAAMQPYNHNVKFDKVKKLFDSYVECGGSQMEFFVDVLMPTLVSSGFFTKNQREEMELSLEEMKENL